MKTLAVARKSLLEIWHEPQFFALVLLMPLFFLLITYIGYGHTPRLGTYRVLVLGAEAPVQPLLNQLAVRRYQDGRQVYTLQATPSRPAADADLQAGKADALIIFDRDSAGKLRLTLRGDGTSMRFIIASTFLSKTASPFMDQLAGLPAGLEVSERDLAVGMPVNDFEAYTPGMMIFAILMLIPQTAMLLGRELRKGTLNRLRLTPVSPAALLSGISLAQMAIAALQVILMFLAALALGFHNHGSLSLAVGIGLLLSFSAIGFGLIMACFSPDDSAALNLGSTIAMLQVFLSGAFFAMPSPPIFNLAGHLINWNDLIPATHGMLALQQVFNGGAGLETTGFRIAMMAGLSALYFLLGIVIFNWRRMQRFA